MTTREAILTTYLQGWHDEADDRPRVDFDAYVLSLAYNEGRAHYIIGDDVRSVDYLTEDEIIDGILAKVKR